jgi:hypothetical protein
VAAAGADRSKARRDGRLDGAVRPTIDAAKKYVVSSTLTHVDWNAELVRGDRLETAVRGLKQQPGKGLLVGGVKLPVRRFEARGSASVPIGGGVDAV